MTKETYLYGYAPLSNITKKVERVGRFDFKLYEAVAKGVVYFNRLDVLYWAFEKQNKQLLKTICNLAAREGRIGVLNEVLRNIGGALDELWNYILTDDHEDYKGSIFQDVDFHAAYRAWGGQLRVLKWLKEQEFPWDKRTFRFAAEGGNLNILQWLHKEGCSWPERTWYRVHEDVLKPDVVEWLRSHGYSNRIGFEY